ncbi:MAG: hypothetical protein ACYS5V_01475, partial [Planctomycetota bacterium]
LDPADLALRVEQQDVQDLDHLPVGAAHPEHRVHVLRRDADGAAGHGARLVLALHDGQRAQAGAGGGGVNMKKIIEAAKRITTIRHDCEMTFPDKDGLGWIFVCKCGYTTTDMWSAARHDGLL